MFRHLLQSYNAFLGLSVIEHVLKVILRIEEYLHHRLNGSLSRLNSRGYLCPFSIWLNEVLDLVLEVSEIGE